MPGKGFSLIELMVVILLIGIVTAIGLPRFLRSPVSVSQDFIFRLNSLTAEAVEQAQKEGAPRRIFFNLPASLVEIQSAQGKRVGGTLTIPPTISLRDIAINGVSQFHQGSGEKRTCYFLINAEGLGQEVLLILDEQTSSGATKQYDFYLNPFTSLFRVVQ